jgi:hypothetical protein
VIEWAKGYSEPEMYAYVFGADAPPDAIAAEAVVSTAVDGPDRPAVEDGSSEPADAEQRAAGPFSAMRLILSQRMRAVQLGGGKPGGDASEAAAAAPEPAAVDAGKALVLELGALRGNSYGLYHRALGVGLAELLRLGGATPTLGSVSKWATALGLKDAKVVRDVEWFLATADKVYDVEERKLVRAHACERAAPRTHARARARTRARPEETRVWGMGQNTPRLVPLFKSGVRVSMFSSPATLTRHRTSGRPSAQDARTRSEADCGRARCEAPRRRGGWHRRRRAREQNGRSRPGRRRRGPGRMIRRAGRRTCL